MGSINPARRWNGQELVTEVDETFNECPVVEVVVFKLTGNNKSKIILTLPCTDDSVLTKGL
jgi:hypothetical protein